MFGRLVLYSHSTVGFCFLKILVEVKIDCIVDKCEGTIDLRFKVLKIIV